MPPQLLLGTAAAACAPPLTRCRLRVACAGAVSGRTTRQPRAPAAGRHMVSCSPPGGALRARRSRPIMDALADRAATAGAHSSECLITTSITATTVADALKELAEAEAAGADVVELRLDFLERLDPAADLPTLLAGTRLPAIATYRPNWEGGRYAGPEEARLRALWHAFELGAAFVDVELKAAAAFVAAAPAGWSRGKTRTRLILSSHNYAETPALEQLLALHTQAVAAGADIVKLATTATRIMDVSRLVALLDQTRATPTIALGMGEPGLISRLLAPKFGSFLTFGALRSGKESAPGQPTLAQLVNTFRLHSQGPASRVLGVIGKPISHSRSPVLHNAALHSVGEENTVYVPLLVDDLPEFLRTDPFKRDVFAGFSVTIPHKEVALKCCDEVDPVALRIGAVNTLVRQRDGKLKGYNTDASAALDAIEAGGGSVKGKSVLVVGAGGAGRAVAFEAAHRGARVLIANRSDERAVALAADVGAQAVPWADLQEGRVRADVLANTTSVGMVPDVEATPVPASAVVGFGLVFDAVYTPLETRLLRDAKSAGAVVVSGVEMFVGQAARQFVLFTGKPAPVELMRKTLMTSLGFD